MRCRLAQARGALTFALAGAAGDYTFALPDPDPWLAQEIVEVLYHLLWETVHVYFEHREQGHDVGASSFLYPFLGSQAQPLEAVVDSGAGVDAAEGRGVEQHPGANRGDRSGDTSPRWPSPCTSASRAAAH